MPNLPKVCKGSFTYTLIILLALNISITNSVDMTMAIFLFPLLLSLFVYSDECPPLPHKLYYSTSYFIRKLR